MTANARHLPQPASSGAASWLVIFVSIGRRKSTIHAIFWKK